MLEMRDAGEPEVHWPPECKGKGVSGGSRTEVAAGGGNRMGSRDSLGG